MTDKEKIVRHDAIQMVRQKIGGCFGDADKIFAGHPFDEGRAKELRKLAFDSKLTLREVREIALAYLYDFGCIQEHIREQIESVNKFFGKKLS